MRRCARRRRIYAAASRMTLSSNAAVEPLRLVATAREKKQHHLAAARITSFAQATRSRNGRHQLWPAPGGPDPAWHCEVNSTASGTALPERTVGPLVGGPRPALSRFALCAGPRLQLAHCAAVAPRAKSDSTSWAPAAEAAPRT
eukprot:3609700-Pyramimonas_sp.AAC.1